MSDLKAKRQVQPTKRHFPHKLVSRIVRSSLYIACLAFVFVAGFVYTVVHIPASQSAITDDSGPFYDERGNDTKLSILIDSLQQPVSTQHHGMFRKSVEYVCGSRPLSESGTARKISTKPVVESEHDVDMYLEAFPESRTRQSIAKESAGDALDVATDEETGLVNRDSLALGSKLAFVSDRDFVFEVEENQSYSVRASLPYFQQAKDCEHADARFYRPPADVMCHGDGNRAYPVSCLVDVFVAW
eukprot:jgi/Hompol1/3244/HPOL_006462-RA